MSRERLEQAQMLIIREEYDAARNILEDLKDRSSTARRWLANLNEVDPPSAEAPQEQSQTIEEEPSIDEIVDQKTEWVSDTALEDIDDDLINESEPIYDPDPADDEYVVADVTDAFEQDDDLMDDEPSFEQPEQEDEVEAPMASNDDMPVVHTSQTLSPTAASGEYQAFSETFTHDARTRWEYREIVLANWDQHLSNIEYALEQGSGGKITIEDAYVQLLNENGAQGWEVIAEEILPQQYIRLLMKRPVT